MQILQNSTAGLNDFDLIADFYDELVSWARYDAWISDLLTRLGKLGLEPDAGILDAACGTGLSTIPLARRGFRVAGMDHSPAMLKIAQRKITALKLDVELLQGDLLEFNPDRTFDAAICLHSGLDYILDIKDLQKAFENIRKCLRPGGLFAFDKCLDEPGFYRETCREQRTLKNGLATLVYRWDRKLRTFEQDCRINYKDAGGNERCIRMLQRMTAVPLEQLLDMVEKAGFTTLEKLRQFTAADPGMGIFRAV